MLRTLTTFLTIRLTIKATTLCLAGGWPELTSKPAPKDLDRDGMADTWELANNLDPKNPTDRNGDADKDGYTNLEEYLNSLCP